MANTQTTESVQHLELLRSSFESLRSSLQTMAECERQGLAREAGFNEGMAWAMALMIEQLGVSTSVFWEGERESARTGERAHWHGAQVCSCASCTVHV